MRFHRIAALYQLPTSCRASAYFYPAGLNHCTSVSGDKIKAKSSYEDFLTLWKDADPDIRILKKAKTEYAKLQ